MWIEHIEHRRSTIGFPPIENGRIRSAADIVTPAVGTKRKREVIPKSKLHIPPHQDSGFGRIPGAHYCILTQTDKTTKNINAKYAQNPKQNITTKKRNIT